MVEEGDRQRFADLAGLPVAQFVDMSDATTRRVTSSHPAADDVAFLQFSSGTTGHRKGVTFTHRRVLAQIEALAATLRLDRECRIVSWLPLYHDMGLIACLLLPVLTGVPLVLLDPLEWVNHPASLFEQIERQRATHVWLPNFAFNHLAQTVRADRHFDLSSMRAWINCSEPCKKASFDIFLQRFGAMGVTAAQLQTCYAMAEAVFVVTHSPPGQVVAHSASGVLSAGSLLPGMAVQIQDTRGSPLPPGRVGEIAIRGSCVFDGYFRGENSNSEAFRDEWFLTGDLGCIDNGELYVVGRSKDVIIVNGKNLFAHDIEATLAAVPGIKPGRALALGVFNELSGSEELVILAETTEHNSPALRRVVKESVRQSFGIAVTRTQTVAPGWLIKTTSGKLDRKRNKLRYMDGLRHG